MSASGPIQAPASLLRRLIRTTLVAAMVLLPIVAVCAVLAMRSPAWWKPLARADSAAADRAAMVEQAIVAEFSRVRSDTPEWSLRLLEADANAWLATRLPAWLESRGAEVPGPGQALFGPGWGRGGVELPRAIVWWQAEPRAAEGGCHVQGLRAGIGRLPLPAASILPSLPLDRLGAERSIRLADGRMVRLIDLEVLPGEIRMRLRTEPVKAPGPGS